MQLLGREFQTVQKGLDPDDVVEFLKAATGSSEDVFRRLEQFSALQTATRTVEESISQARRLADYAKKQAESEARQKKTQVVSEAGQQAALMIGGVKENCISAIDNTHDALLVAIQETIESARGAVSTKLVQLSEIIQEAAKERLDKWQTAADENPSGKLQTAVELEEAVPDLINNLNGSVAGLVKGDSRPAKEPEVDSTYYQPSGTEDSSKSEENKDSIAPDLSSSEVVEVTEGLYSGTVSIIIPRGVRDTWMHQFRSRLSRAPGIKIQGETEKDKERIEVILALEKPTKLLPLLQDLPNVRKVMEAWNAGSSPEGWGPGRASRGTKKPEEVALILQFA